MSRSPKKHLGTAIGITLFGWAVFPLGIVSLLLVPAFIIGVILTTFKKSWSALFLILALNPVSGHFFGGLFDYARGAPKLKFVGLPVFESFNIDRESRAFRSGGGCLIQGNEWISIPAHNTAIRLAAKCFGPPFRSYDGPFPTSAEAEEFTAQVGITSTHDFLEGTVKLDGSDFQLGSEFTEKLINSLRLVDFSDPYSTEDEAVVRAKIYQDRCLIIRLTRFDPYSASGSNIDIDVMMFFDLRNMRPFAYHRLQGRYTPRTQPIDYLANHGN